MSFLKVSVLGLPNLIRNMERVQTNLQRDLQKALTVAAIRTESRAKVLSPIDTGRLRSSIKSTIGKMKTGASVNVDYAPYIEFGTGRFVSFDSIEDDELRAYAREHAVQFRGRGVRQVNIHPQPFLFPAFERSKNELLIKLRRLI